MLSEVTVTPVPPARFEPSASAVSGAPTLRRILGVDPGTRVLGYALLDWTAPGRFRYVECGCLKVDGRKALNWRLGELTRVLEEIMDELEPQELAIESAFHGKNAASALKLAEIRGALKVLAIRRGLGVHEYAPARIKRAVVGKGRATKAEVQRRVTLLCGLARRPATDAADALAVALCHAHTGR